MRHGACFSNASAVRPAGRLPYSERRKMNYISKCILIGLIGSATFALQKSNAEFEVSASVQIHAVADFDAPLAAHGTWIKMGRYGRCWRPAHMAVGWRPYCHGRWIWTDCGWYWSTDEPSGWACYHYGRWVFDSEAGWVWVPGIEWAPAWVSWRVGGGYCGWAPLAPRGVVVATHTYVFVEVVRLRDPLRPTKVFVNNTRILNHTTAVGKFKHATRKFGGVSQRVIINEGPGVRVIQRATGRRFESVSIREAVRRNPVPSEAVAKINFSHHTQRQPMRHTKDALASPKAGEEQASSHAFWDTPRGEDKGGERGDAMNQRAYSCEERNSGASRQHGGGSKSHGRH
jgi:Family of unknown function (DUF6600)